MPNPLPTLLADRLQLWRSWVEDKLVALSEFEPGCPESLAAAMRYSLLAPGKRLRPLLVLSAAEACGCPPGDALSAACAVEMVHAYSLIHDDLPAMDDDDLRRGRPTCHIKFGEATAILAGDALLALAFEVVARDVARDLGNDAAAACCRILARAAGLARLVGGQADDLLAEQNSQHHDLEYLESIHRRKTGALLVASLQIGGTIAAAENEPMEALETYGMQIGLAFQVVDDLLDHQGNEVALGKRVGRDADLGKLTYPRLLGVEASRQRAEKLVESACRALAYLPGPTDTLESIARYILTRDH